MRPRMLLALLVTLPLAWASEAAAQLCRGTGPCVISVNTDVTSGTVIDIGTRDFTIASGKALTVKGAGIFTLIAGTVTLEANAKIFANGPGGTTATGGSILLDAAGAVTMAEGSLIDVAAANGGTIDVFSAVGTVTLGGRLKADATVRQGLGGDISVDARNGSVVVAGLGVQAIGGDVFGGGGTFLVDAVGDVTVNSPVQLKGSDGGEMDVLATGNVTVASSAEINLNGNDVESGDGGDLDIDAGGDIRFHATIKTVGAGERLFGAGSGGFIDFIALGAVVFSGTVEGKGQSPDGDGANIDLDAAEISYTGVIDATGPAEGGGGALFWIASGGITIAGTIDARAGLSGGSFSYGGDIDIDSESTLLLTATAGIRAGAIRRAGFLRLGGCTVVMRDGALLENVGPFAGGAGSELVGVNLIAASNGGTIGGTARASQGNVLQWRSSQPTVLQTAEATPAWTLMQRSTLPCCGVCTPATTSTSSTSSTSVTVVTTSTTTSSTSVRVTTSTTSSVTSTTASSSTSVTVTTSSLTSTSASTTSTSTTLVTACAVERVVDFDAAGCAVARLDEDVRARPDDELGGGRKATGLRRQIEKSIRLLEKGRVATKARKAARFVRRARKKIERFEKKVTRLVEKGGRITLPVAQEMLELSAVARTRLETLEAEILGGL